MHEPIFLMETMQLAALSNNIVFRKKKTFQSIIWTEEQHPENLEKQIWETYLPTYQATYKHTLFILKDLEIIRLL